MLPFRARKPGNPPKPGRPATAVLLLLFALAMPPAATAVGLYEIFEVQVTNDKTYTNPFDYQEIELQGVFTSPTGKVTNFFGFYDGDGSGGQSGNVWKIRFMPTEIGTYTYSLSFTDGTPISNATGSFTVTGSGLPGPVQLYSSDNRFLADASDTPIKWKAYSLAFAHIYFNQPDPKTRYRDVVSNMIGYIDNHLVAQGYNATMIESPLEERGNSANLGTGGEGLNMDGDMTRFNLANATAKDRILDKLAQEKIWVINWVAFTHQNRWNGLWDNYRTFLRYFVARYAAYYNYFAWAPTWETWELTDEANRVETMAKYIDSISPWPKFPTTHDKARSAWSDWQRIQLRQQQSRTIFDGNTRTADGYSGYQYVIIGAEDNWEYCNGEFGQPRNGTEVRRGVWGSLFAGVYTMYSEWNHKDGAQGPCAGNTNGEGDAYNKIAMDFWYDNTRWYQYQMLNGLVSASQRQIASGILGEEYIVYDEDGGNISIDLSDAGSGDYFSVLWFNPLNGNQQSGGTIQGGAIRQLTPPFPGEVVLLLKSTSPPSSPAATPTGLDFKFQ